MVMDEKSVKAELRNRIWDLLQEKNVARSPLPPHGRIPNFEGSQVAARRLSEIEVWKNAKVIKINPDSPQQPVRQTALEQDKVLYMAVPRLREEKCFIELNPKRLKTGLREATTIRGANKRGRPVTPDQMKPVDLVVAGSVTVNRWGGRIGKGGGYSELEYALGMEVGILDERTPVVTTVHSLQIVNEQFTLQKHDLSLDHIATPERCSPTEGPRKRPPGIIWDLLSQEQINAMPILRILKKMNKS